MSNVNVSVSGPASATRRATGASPEIEGLVLDIFHSLYRKSVSNEIVLRESDERIFGYAKPCCCAHYSPYTVNNFPLKWSWQVVGEKDIPFPDM